MSLVVDGYTLLRIATAIRARQAVIENGLGEHGLAAANAAFKHKMFMDYSENISFRVLEENATIRDKLIEFLEYDLHVVAKLKPKTAAFADAIKKRDELWDNYELLRRMFAFDDRALIAPKSHERFIA